MRVRPDLSRLPLAARRIVLPVALLASTVAVPVPTASATLSDLGSSTEPDAAAASADATSTAAEKGLCGPEDLVETGLQGEVPLADQLSGRATEGYNCGVSLVGHVGFDQGDYGANMAWVDHCAYVATAGSGVAVIDVSDPANPTIATTLHGDGSDFTLETLAANQERRLLATGRYGPAPLGAGGPMDLWDVSDCTSPQLLSTYTWPTNTHNLTFTKDGTRLWSTLPLQVVDVTDPSAPVWLGNIEEDLQARAEQDADFDHRFRDEFLSHEAWLSDDGNTLYVGGQLPTWETFSILDVTNYPEEPIEILSQQIGRGHSVRTATIDGTPYVLHSEESIVDPTAKGCFDEALNPVGGASQPWLTDITDPTAPRMEVSQFRLEINEQVNCPTQVADNMNSSVHYHDVDDADDTTFAMLSMWNSGLRIVDLRDPLNPTEVGYFNPGLFEFFGGGGRLDIAWGHVRYVPETGHIWFATAHGGFWVVELQAQVRDHLGLKKPKSNNGKAHGRDGVVRPAATRAPIPEPTDQTTTWYCTLDIASLPVRSELDSIDG